MFPKNWRFLIFLSSLLLLLFAIFSFFALIFFVDPKIQKFEDYKRLHNWDLLMHAFGDFDNDGKEDMFSFTGCAFLSSVPESVIPEDLRCTATGIRVLLKEKGASEVGQKFLPLERKDLNLDYYFEEDNGFEHSYLGKKSGKWYLYLNTDRLRAYGVDKGKILEESPKSVTPETKIDESLYFFSRAPLFYLFPLIKIFEQILGSRLESMAASSVVVIGLLAAIWTFLFFAPYFILFAVTLITYRLWREQK